MNESLFILPRQTFDELQNLTGASPIPVEFTLHDPAVRIGTDDFCITGKDGRLILAAGNVRGLFYAVYEYFERFCGCRWFWDNDVIPQHDSLPTDGIHYVKRFRMKYRGLRYFAHRSLYRFQAEHWNLEDWRKEIDYLLKKHFSLFMLRIGNDDLFQKAFPDIVPYPPVDGPAPEAVPRSYNDRTELISLQYRGKLRKQILDYAFARGLMHPEDMGPTTHWYSYTPKAFLDHFKPRFMNQSSSNYDRMETHVWDCDDETNIDRYMELTLAHIRHYGRPELFHIIGLAERLFGSTPEENYATKVRVMRNFIAKLRNLYPNAPLLIASWDFMMRWDASEVRKFLQELDPENMLILDYTTDSDCFQKNFLAWNLPHHFPWIFGIFQAYEPQNDLFFDFNRANEMLVHTRHDPMCKGMVLWSENSHVNPLLLEYLAKKSTDEPFSLKQFCQDRYGQFAGKMQELWNLTESAFASNTWPMSPVNHFELLQLIAKLTPERASGYNREYSQRIPKLEIPFLFYEKAISLAKEDLPDPVKRDLADLVRSAWMCRILQEMFRIMVCLTDRSAQKADGTKLVRLIGQMGNLLETLPEFSLNVTLERMKATAELNSYASETLRNNAENSYCRSYIYELYRGIYEPEAKSLARYLTLLPVGSLPQKEELDREADRIRNEFYAKPLSAYAPHPAASFSEVLQQVSNAYFPALSC